MLKDMQGANAQRKDGFEIIANRLEISQKRMVFAQIRKFSILLNFGMNEDLCEKLLKIKYFKVWIAFAQQDRRIMKLMQRALRFHNKTTKAKIFRAWQMYGMNTEVYKKYAIKLMGIAF